MIENEWKITLFNYATSTHFSSCFIYVTSYIFSISITTQEHFLLNYICFSCFFNKKKSTGTINSPLSQSTYFIFLAQLIAQEKEADEIKWSLSASFLVLMFQALLQIDLLVKAEENNSTQ